jgi:hydroxypyruvate isomerase
MFDVYHTEKAEGQVLKNLKASSHLCGHIQIADFPGRHEPRIGEIDWIQIFRTVELSGYTGWIGCEYRPTIGTIASLDWMKELNLAS